LHIKACLAFGYRPIGRVDAASNGETIMPHCSLPLALAAASLLVACAPYADSAAARAEAREAALGVVAAYNRQDAHAAAAYDAPDYVGVYHGTPNTVGPAADEAGMKAQMAAAKVDWQLGKDQVTVSQSGDLAVFEAPYTFVINIPGAPETRESGSWIAIFKRQGDGSLKLWRSIASDHPGAAAAPPAPTPAK
jgi:ketosteroid isomerase-like protein